METRLNSMQQQMVLNRKELVNYALAELGITQDHREYEDIVSVGTTALVMATSTFDPETEWSFEEYAFDCIIAEISEYCSKEEEYENHAYTSETIITEDGERLTVEEVIADYSTSMESEVYKREMEEKVISIILNCLTPKQRFITLCRFGTTLKLMKIESILDIKGVSTAISTSIIKIRRVLTFNTKYEKNFDVKLIEDSYFIKFKCKNIEILKESFIRAKNAFGCISMELMYSNGNVTIEFPRSFTSLGILAYILNGTDEFKVTFIKQKGKKPRKKTSKKEMPSDEKEMRGRVITHMLRVHGFTVKQLKKAFPECNPKIINSTVNEARNRAWIKRVRKATYVVNNFF